MRLVRTFFATLCAVLLVASQGSLVFGSQAGKQAAVFPAAAWEQGDLKKLGWSADRLEEARKFFTTLPPASVFIVDHGYVVAAWGDPALRVKLSSARKSLLSALYGVYVESGQLHLDDTMAQLGIDDQPPITREEKQATVRMLLEARSGVYHTFVAGTPAMVAAMPARGSHALGTFWYYNNWDFNTLGAIFEQQTHTGIGPAFQDRIATPLQMQDFRLEDMYYVGADGVAKRSADSAAESSGAKNSGSKSSGSKDSGDGSIHPAYHFRLTARDMARFGYLFLRQGNWQGKQIVPADWVRESTTAYSTPSPGEGYGYLWWVDGFGLPVKSFSAQGALAKYIVVIPERDLVVVYQNHTELPDNSQLMTEAEVGKLPTISHEKMSELLKLVLAAQR